MKATSLPFFSTSLAPITYLPSGRAVPFDIKKSTSSLVGLSFWKSVNYCDEPVTIELYDSNPDDSFYIHRILFDNGVNGSKVDHYKVYGGEHIWFMDDDINSSELIWEFFSRHDLNGYIN